MTREEVARLLSGIEATDARKHFNPNDLTTWVELVGDLRFEDAKAAVMEHYRNSAYPILPADIRRRCEAVKVERAKAAALRRSGPSNPCRSTRCTCDHSTCDLGWIAAVVTAPNGHTSEAFRKCPECFPTPPSSTPGGHLVHTDPMSLALGEEKD